MSRVYLYGQRIYDNDIARHALLKSFIAILAVAATTTKMLMTTNAQHSDS